MQMMVFGVNGQVEAERGPLRVTRIAPQAGSPLQVLVITKGFLRVCSPCPVGRSRSISSAHRCFHVLLRLLFLFGGALVVQLAPFAQADGELDRDPLR